MPGKPKTARKKATSKKSKKATSKKTTSKKTTSKKTTSKKTTSKKTTSKKTTSKKTAARQRSVPADVTDKLLRQLEAGLKKSYPRRLATFGKPVKNLDALERVLGKDVPGDVAAIYAWHGSAPGLLVDRNTDESYNGWDLSSPQGVIADWKIWKRLKPKGWKPDWIPLFSNGAGDNVCLDASSGKLVGMFHETPRDHPVIFASLDSALSYVLSRVQKGTWCGVPETKELESVLAKIGRQPEMYDLFGNDIFRLMKRDPRAGLAAIAAAEKAKAPPSLVHKFRARAQLAAGNLDQAYASFQQYLLDALASGSVYNPPFRTMRDGFAAANQKVWAFEAGEVLAMDEANLFEAWLERKSKASMKDVIELADALIEGTDPEEEVRGWIKYGMSEKDARKKVKALVSSGRLAAATGAGLARACAAKAQALHVLGKAADAKKLWAQAQKAEPGVTAFWKAFSGRCAKPTPRPTAAPAARTSRTRSP